MAGESGGGRRRGKRSRSSDVDLLDATLYDSKLFPKPDLHHKLVMSLHRDTRVYVKHDKEWRACTLQHLYCQQRDPEVVNRYASDYMYVHLEAEVAIPSLPDIVNKTVKAEAIKFKKPQKKPSRSGMDLSVANDNEEEEGMCTHYKKCPHIEELWALFSLSPRLKPFEKCPHIEELWALLLKANNICMADSLSEEEEDEEDENHCRVVEPTFGGCLAPPAEDQQPLLVGLRATRTAEGGPSCFTSSSTTGRRAPPKVDQAVSPPAPKARPPQAGVGEDAKKPMDHILHYLGIHQQEMIKVEEHKTNLEVENAGLKSELQDVNAKFQDVNAKLQDVNDKYQTTNGLLQHVTDNLKVVHTKLKKAQDNIDLSAERYDVLKQDYEQSRSSYERLQNMYDASQMEIFSHVTEVNDYKKIIASHVKSTVEQSKTIEQLETKLSDRETTIKQYDIQVKRLEASNKAKDILVLQSQLAAQNAQIASDEAQVEIQQTIKRSKVAGINVFCPICSDEIANLAFKCGHLTCCEKCYAKKPWTHCIYKCGTSINQDPGPIIKMFQLTREAA